MARARSAGRGSLLGRLLVLSAVVSLLSIGATAWLAVRTTTRAIQREQGQALTDDAKIYDTLLGYAATHRDWSAVAPVVAQLAGSTGHRVVLTGQAREPIADSASGPLPQQPLTTVDPTDAGNRIDPRAVGPFRLTTAERAGLRQIAARVQSCLREPSTPAPARDGQQRVLPHNVEIVDEPSGRPRLETPGSDLSADTVTCMEGRTALAAPTATEATALQQLDRLVNSCLARQHLPAVTIGLENTWTWADAESARSGRRRNQPVADCLTAGRREQLAGWVAPAALLFVTAPGEQSARRASTLDLSRPNQIRIGAVTGLVLLAAIGVTALVGVRLVRPLRALTAAAGRMRDGDATARVRVTGRDEIARLATAFNDMADRRRHVEQLRHAMVGDIAHEMRTPVTNIRGWLEAAADGVVPLDRELMASLLEEAMLLQHVIDDLQDLSAADAGELRLHPQLVEVAELLPAITDAFTAAADRAGVTLHTTAASALVTVDPIRIRQAVGNLITNAIRHTPSGGRIDIISGTSAGRLRIDVTDTGPGIPPEQQALVFERFWRADKSRSRQTGGSGLGLSIVRKLAEAHAGTVTVTSPPGQGATFRIDLPVAGPPGSQRAGRGSMGR
ncbi:histidine kinase [Actinoplanes sp. SE50]|uniref:sensor histidine kinase n=1 Tax=unclassified Actinoplanes TaxID=2626549 RepID=UPI00023EBD58|nr:MULTISPECIES: HAMP domain-containing sensor histidine kinase [unclassified Actinoplanes]AEV85086.1 histidine kinase [Actinoplanes sp. SE50/110]ATO83477.1 histidine kinase [Actinoplanes sp. SE50]SLM00884.1 histidine kinase [Actinoplanes sp. SE50/110]